MSGRSARPCVVPQTNLAGMFPEALGPSLIALNLSHTDISGAAPLLAAATALVTLDLSHTHASAVGDALADRAALRWVDLS